MKLRGVPQKGHSVFSSEPPRPDADVDFACGVRTPFHPLSCHQTLLRNKFTHEPTLYFGMTKQQRAVWCRRIRDYDSPTEISTDVQH
jgi:hypothetical protein